MQNAQTKNEVIDWLTIDEAAAHLKISKRSLYDLIGGNKIPSYKPEGTYMRRFKREELDAYLTSARTTSESEAMNSKRKAS